MVEGLKVNGSDALTNESNLGKVALRKVLRHIRGKHLADVHLPEDLRETKRNNLQ